MTPRTAFGPRLRAHRERQGITLESIAARTKIKTSLLAGLERNDVSRWPRGIFRRAFVRDYAAAVGLDPEPLVHEFVTLFPEDGSPPDTAAASARPDPGEARPSLRLSLAADPRDHLRRLAGRAGAAAAEAALVLAAGALVALAGGWGVLATTGVLALVYYPIVAASTGRTAAPRQIWPSLQRLSHTIVEQVHAARRRRMRLVPRRDEPGPRQDDAGENYSRPRRTAAS